MLLCWEMPNHRRYRYGYDAYFYTKQQEAPQNEFIQCGVNILKPLTITDYNNREFVIEDIDRRWIAFGMKE